MTKETPTVPYDPMLADVPEDLKPSSILLRPWDYMLKPPIPIAEPQESQEPPQA